MPKQPLGELELEALRFVAERAPISVGEVAAGFGEPRGLARTTILTVMERLRAKGFLARRKMGSVFRYSPQVDQGDVMRDLVRDFVERRLAGSLSPFVAYLVEEQNLSEEQVAQLRRLVESMEAEEERRP